MPPREGRVRWQKVSKEVTLREWEVEVSWLVVDEHRRLHLHQVPDPHVRWGSGTSCKWQIVVFDPGLDWKQRGEAGAAE
jgi:hypothetical protein